MPKPHHKRPIVSNLHLGLNKKETKAQPHHAAVKGVKAPNRPLTTKPKRKYVNEASSSASGVQCMNAIHNHASFAVRRMLESSGTSNHLNLKSLTLAPHIENKKAVHAVTCQVLKHMITIKDVISRTCQMEQVIEAIGLSNAYVLVYEVLIGQGLGRARKGEAEKAIHALKIELRASLDQILSERNVSSVEELIESSSSAPVHPRWARVNTIKISVSEAIKLFNSPPLSWPVSHQKPLEPSIDDLLNDLLRFPPATDLHDHPLVISGEIILQSKASCMPAHALAPRKGWHIIDCCAAPGNKTTHVSALLVKAGGGHVYAFDKDQRRLKRLNENAARAGASHIITSQCIDFLTVDPNDRQFESVRGILLDPSCSGSGTTTTRMDHLSNNSNVMSQERIEELAIFQEEALRHALSFPNLERLVYSTCSIHDRENEQVVINLLPLAEELGFKLADPFPSWKRRGHDLFKEACHLIRTDSSLDETDGFFIAVFERRNL